jgi:hypothetical protein
MGNNPYDNPQSLADLLWELEAVADKYAYGNVMLIRTKDGWKAHLGTIRDDLLQQLEMTWDKQITRYYRFFQASDLDDIPRQPKLDHEIMELLSDCTLCFQGYLPMKLTEDDPELIEKKEPDSNDSNDEDIPF